VHRWTTTTAVMGAVAWALMTLGPDLAGVRAALSAPQLVVDTQGPDVLLVSVAGALAWLCWAWAALGLVLTGLSAVPGVAGRLAGSLLAAVLPPAARRAAALAVGLGLAATAPTAVSLMSPPPAVAAAGSVSATAAVDWPAGPGTGAVPDWPTETADVPGQHVVLRGDSLWDIAADRLARERPGQPVPDAETARAVDAWWQANADVIGPDPDLLLPGQVLRPPA